MPPNDTVEDVKAALAEVQARTPEEPVEDVAAHEPDTEAVSETAAEARARDERGRFAKGGEPAKPDNKPDEPELPLGLPPKASADKALQAAQTVGKATSAPAAPPHGWSVKAKAEWEKLPPHIREAVLAREGEVNQGFSKFQAYKGLDQYAELAQRSGTTLQEAMGRYVNLENMLRADPAQGLVQVAQNLGWSQQQAAEAFAIIAQRLGYQGNGASQPPPSGAQPAQTGAGVDPNYAALMQHVRQLDEKLSAKEQGEQQRLYSTAVSVEAEFKADPANRYYANVEQTITQLLQSGLVKRTGDFRADLKSAYEQACQLNPEVREALINERIAATTAERVAKEKEAAAKAARASRSISGSLAPGEMAAPPPRQRGESDVRADVRAAMAQIAR